MCPPEAPLQLDRRTLLRRGALATLLPTLKWYGGYTLAGPAAAQTGEEGRSWRHGLSLFGELKYPPEFKRFDYVNPNAPKLGSVSPVSGVMVPVYGIALKSWPG